MYKNIVVGFDNTEYSKAAVIEVSNRVKSQGGKFILVHAVHFEEEEPGITAQKKDERIQYGKNVCYQTKEMVASEFGIEADELVCEGEPAEVITNIAREKTADLIAMGTYGSDVLVVKKPCTECTGTYCSVLLPFDGSEFSKKALKRACQLSESDGCLLTVLYVIPRYEEMIGFFRTESIKKSLMEEANKILDTAREIASAEGVVINMEIREGAPGEEIVKTADKLENDLIVMGTYGWQGVNKAIMGSTTERVIMHASCPVLAVK
jgi:nucleotide-binding universal stress UspA family protein